MGEVSSLRRTSAGIMLEAAHVAAQVGGGQ